MEEGLHGSPSARINTAGVWHEPALPSLRIYSSGREQDKAGAGGWGELWCLIGELKTKFYAL